MYLAKILMIDSNTMVYFLPYMAQLLLAVINDFFIWKLGKKLVGVDSTRIAILLMVSNHF